MSIVELGSAMRFRVSIFLLGACAAWVLPSRAALAAPDCRTLLQDFGRAISSSALEEAKRVEAQIDADPVCGATPDIHSRRVQLQLALLDDPNGPFRSEAERERELADAASATDLWRAHARFAGLRARQGRYREALEVYGRAIEKLENHRDASATEKAELLHAIAAVRIVVNDDDEGAARIAFVPSTRSIDGNIGGVFSRALRAIRPTAIPVPALFETNSTALTPAGKMGFNEMAEAVTQQKPTRIALIGHADQRGTDAHNMELSKGRVEAIRDLLQPLAQGTVIEIEWRGERDPFDTRNLPFDPTPEQILALNRRVDLVLPGLYDH